MGYSIAQALDPEASVFVSANAGAGKTSLLVSRVLRLLLHGVPPSKILCITFTNAAAAEMMSRVQKELGAWVMMDDKKLQETLASLTGKTLDKALLARARSLFANVLEAPEGVRIQTIHGFCQSLLKRFPIEAGISPHFKVMDARTEQEMLKEAHLRLFARAQEEDPRLQSAIAAITQGAGEWSFHTLMRAIIQHKRRIRSIVAQENGAEQSAHTVAQLLNIPPWGTLKSLIEAHFSYDEAMLAQWRRIVRILRDGDEKEQKTGQGITQWLANKNQWETMAPDYINLFLTQKGAPRVSLHKKGTLVDADLIDAIKAEQERVWRFNDAWKALETAKRTAHMLHIAEALLAIYGSLKRARALMDFDDLILTAKALLQKPGIAPWILFKLDGGIDHILVDEAQDTSPEQWSIIDALTQEFYAGLGRKEIERSLFVVGDEKQSIFSFQGADVQALGKMQRYFSERIKDAAKTLHHVALTHSFRSTKEVLSAVDTVFAQPQAKAGLMFEDVALTHEPTRLEQPGLVEVWPLIEPKEDDAVSASTQLARAVADNIGRWLKDGVASAGDIMILVRNRTSLVDKLVRALKRRNIPVAGIDRMALGDNLAVQDLIALGQCILLPEDDLTLAAALKSPVFDVSEEALFQLAWRRGGQSLWERLRHHPAGEKAFALLTDLRAKADFISPYELYAYALDTLGARRRFTGRMGEEYHDPIDEFLGQALLYERSHPPSLQGFLHWLSSSESEIKRDMEQSKDAVRIMTVHGAKGLQAPIVILPDTVEIPRLKDTLLWYDGDKGTLPFWPLSSDRDDAFCAGLRDAQKEAMYAEYRRLLYVALTRAEDRLYICGATNREKINEQCWYQLVSGGLKPLATPFEMPWGEGLRMGRHPVRREATAQDLHQSHEILRLASLAQDDNMFAFLQNPASVEPTPPRPLSPSRMPEEPAAASPLAANALYQRGNLIHKLLQYLPDIPAADRECAAEAIASVHQYPEATECIREAMGIIAHPQFAFIFGEGTLAEVPVAGCITVGGKPVAISGQIDRLYIGEEVWIVDFKSNREPPEAIPHAYLRQLGLYRLLLRAIYPQKTVRCALLWTVAARITAIDDRLLDEALSGSYITH